jgi:hypothetical protein
VEEMTQALKGRIPTADKLADAWAPVYRMLGFGKVRTEREYNRAIRIMDEIVDEVGDNALKVPVLPLRGIQLHNRQFHPSLRYFPID